MRRRSGSWRRAFGGHRQGSATARRYELSRSLLTRWRKEYREGLLGGAIGAFTPLQIAPEPASAISTANEKPGVENKVEITLPNGRRLSVASTIDATALSRLLRVLERA
ncbi:IS66 family insertion sequence element accessory protein TnpB [uncultured Jannaschia sp.]|uniref:IS66 family insertion sequence element accessory protein TnpB n=1 Tax=uncultured Jannaschia sp. TaxID=293347 RepID=UPI0026232984|nr:IS66 family insertion sequence element accessory protein TnpB [uncultured Jannaschia sp.]